MSGLCDDTPELQHLCFTILEQLGRQYETENRDEVIEKIQYGVDGDERFNYNLPLPPPFTGKLLHNEAEFFFPRNSLFVINLDTHCAQSIAFLLYSQGVLALECVCISAIV